VHGAWHVAVLAATLLATGGLALMLLAPLLFEGRPPGLRRARPVVLGAVVAAAALLVVEWLVVHPRSL
jgi:hypothetical protein